jgi:hypothetical protein
MRVDILLRIIYLRLIWLAMDAGLALHSLYARVYFGIRYRFMSRESVLDETIDRLKALVDKPPRWMTPELARAIDNAVVEMSVERIEKSSRNDAQT